jgi:hypothetical protein
LYIEKQPNILIEMIKKIDGFDTITATQFITKMPIFLDLLNKIPQSIQDRILLEVPEDNTISDKTFNGLKIVFSGFRNKDWEKIIESKGGEISSSVSKNTSILVSNKEDIEAKTKVMYKEGNYWSPQVSNYINFYGFNYYVPYKGRPDLAMSKNDNLFYSKDDPLSKRFHEATKGMGGR